MILEARDDWEEKACPIPDFEDRLAWDCQSSRAKPIYGLSGPNNKSTIAILLSLICVAICTLDPHNSTVMALL